MDYNEILETLIRVIIVPIIPLLGVYIKMLMETKINEIQSKIDNQNLTKQLGIAKEVLKSCVVETYETYVKPLKEQNLFHEEEQVIALEKTKEKFLSIINEETRVALESAYGDYTKWIETTIENMVKSSKQ